MSTECTASATGVSALGRMFITMTQGDGVDHELLADVYRSLLTAVTGRIELPDALRWVAEGRPVQAVPVHELLAALVSAVDAGLPAAEAALRAATRRALQSALDTSADLLETETVLPPGSYDEALSAIAGCTSTGTLEAVTAEALAAAQSSHSVAVEALALTAGLVWRDLRDRASARGTALPSKPAGPWKMSQLRAVFAVVDEVVRGTVEARLPGAVAARPLELLLSDDVSGWAAVERMRVEGVSYGLLLAQRDVGGAWGAHRNRTNNAVSGVIVNELLLALQAAGVTYWSTGGPKSEQVPKSFLAEHAASVDNPPGQLSVVARALDGSARLAVFVAIARDGGTARKTAATLLDVPAVLKVPGALVLVGPGWASRGESDELVRAFSGRVFTDQTLHDLAQLAATTSRNV